MDKVTLLKPTLHIEVQLKTDVEPAVAAKVTAEVITCIKTNYVSLEVNDIIEGLNTSLIACATVADYTGPPTFTKVYSVDQTELDIQTYFLKGTAQQRPARRQPGQLDEAHDQTVIEQASILPLPNVKLVGEWDSLVYEDALPAQLLRCLVRMLGVMKQPGLNLSTFNWNRLCLLHGPPGSGKSTLCRALAQKLSIRLSKIFSKSLLVEVNSNTLLSKYFGESGKLVSQLFDQIIDLARSPSTLVCVVIDEIETIAGSRQKSTDGGECSDGLRATNQLLTALDKLRASPNIMILCTSNLINAIDQAFLDRVDIKQLIPSPSQDAIYNIFRSCLNELVRSSLIDLAATESAARPVNASTSPPHAPATQPAAKRRAATRSRTKQTTPPPSELPPQSSSPWTVLEPVTVPTLAAMMVLDIEKPQSPGRLVWDLAQKCEGFSGRTLRRLPILGLAMHTWGGDCSLHDAIAALDAAIEQELKTK